MTYTFKLSRRLASLERPLVPMLALLLLLGCNEGALTGDSESADGPTFDSASSGPVIEPKSAVAQTNQSIQFKVRPRSGGDWGKTTVSWMVSGGTITGAGLFTAAQPGRYKVTVRCGGGKRQ